MREPQPPARRRLATPILIAILIGTGAVALVVALVWGPLTGAVPPGHAPPVTRGAPDGPATEPAYRALL